MHIFEYISIISVICSLLLAESGFCAFFHPKGTGNELSNYFWDVQSDWGKLLFKFDKY